LITGGCKIDLSTIEINKSIKKYRILITGVAGFIGSNLLEFFLKKGFTVKGMDNFATGYQKNIDEAVDEARKETPELNFDFLKGDIKNYDDCINATCDVDIVFHEAALGSVQRSIENPKDSNDTNVSGTLNMLNASVENGVKRFIFASSSSIYGDSKKLPKEESMEPNPRSIYAVSKMASEYYVRLFYKIYKLQTVSLRYFNIFGKRQDFNSTYSAVIPLLLKAFKLTGVFNVYGDGYQDRDFTYIDNVIYANLLAMVSENSRVFGNYYNVGCGNRTSINEIIKYLEKRFKKSIDIYYKEKRKGDIRSSLASLDKIKYDINYEPIKRFYEGIDSLLKINISL
jgi:UDP-N-acetylglucosamine/UDP-N-acetylgalactosamine 4-epimerase